jgi:hypothetical protein
MLRNVRELSGASRSSWLLGLRQLFVRLCSRYSTLLHLVARPQPGRRDVEAQLQADLRELQPRLEEFVALVLHSSALHDVALRELQAPTPAPEGQLALELLAIAVEKVEQMAASRGALADARQQVGAACSRGLPAALLDFLGRACQPCQVGASPLPALPARGAAASRGTNQLLAAAATCRSAPPLCCRAPPQDGQSSDKGLARHATVAAHLLGRLLSQPLVLEALLASQLPEVLLQSALQASPAAAPVLMVADATRLLEMLGSCLAQQHRLLRELRDRPGLAGLVAQLVAETGQQAVSSRGGDTQAWTAACDRLAAALQLATKLQLLQAAPQLLLQLELVLQAMPKMVPFGGHGKLSSMHSVALWLLERAISGWGDDWPGPGQIPALQRVLQPYLRVGERRAWQPARLAAAPAVRMLRCPWAPRRRAAHLPGCACSAGAAAGRKGAAACG